MFAAGPMWTRRRAELGRREGLVIVRARLAQAAIAIAERDPMHKSGARSFQVRPWLINEGTLTRAPRLLHTDIHISLATYIWEEAMRILLDCWQPA
jgi:hypothetical protein